MRDVADRAGVAISSVSRVLSSHPDVSQGMRNRVLAAVDALGYNRDILAQALRRGKTLSVGFIVGDISNPLFATIVKAAEERLRAEGYTMLLTNSDGDPGLDVAHLRLFDQHRVDGVILSLAEEGHEPTVRLLESIQTPLVVLDRDLPPTVKASRVLSDHQMGMRPAVDHLLELGHRNIGVVLAQPGRPTNERLAAVERAFAARGLAPSYQSVEGRYSVQQGNEMMRALLDGASPPTAVIVAGNQLLVGALEVVKEKGIVLGRDVSLVSCDEVALTELFDPPIAVVRRDVAEIGRVAADVLLAKLRGEEAPDEVMLPTEFVARPSCGPPSP